MTWWRYVVTVAGDATQKDIASATGIDQSSISRWHRGTNAPRAEAVVAFARAYERSPVEALVAAGYLSSSEMGVLTSTTLTGDLSGASIESLVSEIRARPMSDWRQADDLCPGPFCIPADVRRRLPAPEIPGRITT
ncbi:helix-turn-helix transcriptional regulator [Mycobacterium hodleri]|nr:helix-turn-helix transcriptional regulator [Mycolicibacterium hodleri]